LKKIRIKEKRTTGSLYLKKKSECLLFTILHSFGTRESIRRKVDHGGQIVLWYWQHATNLARATVFIVYMSPVRVLVWVRARAEQKCSLTFCVFGQEQVLFILYLPQVTASTNNHSSGHLKKN